MALRGFMPDKIIVKSSDSYKLTYLATTVSLWQIK